jgi:hypothetical protein
VAFRKKHGSPPGSHRLGGITNAQQLKPRVFGNISVPDFSHVPVADDGSF